jgi:hypothetical protein
MFDSEKRQGILICVQTSDEARKTEENLRIKPASQKPVKVLHKSYD